MTDKKKLSWSDENANRRAAPFTKPQKPASTYDIKSAAGKNLGSATMNYGGVAGGNPTRSAKELDRRAKSSAKSGATDSAKAASDRANAVRKSDRMNAEAKRDMKSQARERAAKERREKPRLFGGNK